MKSPTFEPTFDLTHLLAVFVMLIRIIFVAAALLYNHGPTQIPQDVIAEMVQHVIRDCDVWPLSGKRQSSDATDLCPPKKRKQIEYDREQAKKCVMGDWLGSNPRFPDKLFESTFCVKRSMVDTIINHLAKPTNSGGRQYAELGNFRFPLT